MMLENLVLTFGLLIWVFRRAIVHDELAQQLVELAEKSGVTLDRSRARRAIASGHDDLLRQRILGRHPR